MARRTKKRVKAKYIVRRIFLVVLTLAITGIPVWFFASKLRSPDIPSSAESSEGTAGGASVVYDSEPVANAAPALAKANPAASSSAEKASSKAESSSNDKTSSKAGASSGSESEPENPQSSSAPQSDPEIDKEPEPKPKPAVGDWELLLVNSKNFLPENYEANLELETITENYRVDKRIADNVKRMFADAKKDGINLMICSAYRSVERQQTLFDEKTREYVARGQDEKAAAATASTIVARPGTSEHHTGLALDIVTPLYKNLDEGFASTPAFKWLDKNAHKYGFVLRYPKDKKAITNIIYEPWHYRFVGEKNAAIMKSRGICLEEYVDELQKERIEALNADKKAESLAAEDEPSDAEASEPAA